MIELEVDEMELSREDVERIEQIQTRCLHKHTTAVGTSGGGNIILECDDCFATGEMVS